MPNTFPYQLGEEPVPGYRLVKFLGKGNFGEVWQAKAPGGASVALKVIPDLTSKQAHKEFRALGIIKNLHHPNLVPVNAVWLKDGQGMILDDEKVDSVELPPEFGMDAVTAKGTIQVQSLGSNPMMCELIIAMGLGHKSLFDRLAECKAQGLIGIPLDELLGYMEEAAKAIDYLNADREDEGVRRSGVQHCDIKPHNILITGTSAQVCDFGLARVQGAVRATASLSGTVAYAAPECLEHRGDPSATTDQYSLAVSYYELRTSELPYGDQTLMGIMRASLQGELDFSALPAHEEAVIRRATAREPNARFPSSVAMVKALRAAVDGHRTHGTIAPIEFPSEQPAERNPPVARGLIAAIAAAAVIVLIVGTGWWMLQPPKDQTQQRQNKSNNAQDVPVAKSGANNGSNQDTAIENDISDSANNERPIVVTDPATELIAAADLLAAKGDFTSAIDNYSHAISASPGSAAAHFGRAVALLNTDKLDDAIDDFAAAKRLDSSDALRLADHDEPAHAYLKRAEQRRQMGDYSGAADDCEVVIRDYPQHAATAYCERAASHRDRKDYVKAIEDLNEAIRLSPEFGLAYSRRGFAHLQTQQFTNALADLDKSLDIEQDDIDYLNRAIVYSATGKLREALAELDGLIERDAGNSAAMYQRGLVYRDMADYASAVRDLRGALSLEPENADAKAVLAMLLACAPEADSADLEEALRLGNEARQASSDKNPMHLDALAAVLAQQGDFDQAVARLQAAIELAAGTSNEATYKHRLELYKAKQPYILPAEQ